MILFVPAVVAVATPEGSIVVTMSPTFIPMILASLIMLEPDILGDTVPSSVKLVVTVTVGG